MNYQVVIADRYPVVLAGLRAMLTDKAEKATISSNGFEALSLVLTRKPNLLILGCNLTDLPAIQVVRQIRELDLPTHILIYSAHGENGCLQQMLEAGVTGYLLKTEPQEMVLQAVQTVSRGELWLSSCLVAKTFSLRQNKSSISLQFTPREWTVLQSLLVGKSNSMIAGQFCLNEQVVKNYVTRIYRKLGVTTRAGAILKAAQIGLFTLTNNAL